MPRKTNTRAASGAGTIRQRPDGRWEARYTIGRDPGTGRQVQRSLYAETQADALRQLRQIQSAIENGTYTNPVRLTVGQWLDIWVAEYLTSVRPGTRKSYEEQIKNHIKPALGAVKLQGLLPPAVQALINELSRKKKLSPKTVKNIHGVLHAAMGKAVDIGYIRSNPTSTTALPRIEKPDLTILPEEKLSAFIQAVDNDVYGSLIYVTLFTGARQSEALGLTWDCIDFEAGVITIRRQLQRDRESKTYFLAPLKNDRPRKIFPAPAVMQELRQVKADQAKYQLKAGSAWANSLNLVFTNELGQNLVHRTVVKHFKKAADVIEMPALRFHDLRHSFAVNSLQSGDDVKTVQDALGHHTAAFTLDIYGFVTDKMKQDSSQRMQRFIEQMDAKKDRSI